MDSREASLERILALEAVEELGLEGFYGAEPEVCKQQVA